MDDPAYKHTIETAKSLVGTLSLVLNAARALESAVASAPPPGRGELASSGGKPAAGHDKPALGEPAPGEPVFTWDEDEEARRISLLPIRHADLWALRKRLEAVTWDAQEVDNSRNKADWVRMSPEQRRFVMFQLAFFARIDIDIFDHIEESLTSIVRCLEARSYYAAQGNQEMTHAESYSLQIESVMDGEERDRVLNAVKHFPIIANIQAWVLKWFRSDRPVGEKLIAFAAVEGVLFSASFSSLQWLREQNLLPGITTANEFIVRDEWIHTQFTCCLVRKYLREKPATGVAHEIFSEVVGVLDEFVTESLPVALIGMNAELMRTYVRYQADFVLQHMGYAPYYRVDNPFKFMEKFVLNDVTKTNFFEDPGSQYQNISKESQMLLMIDSTPLN